MTEASSASSFSFLISSLLVSGHRSPGLLPVRFQIFHASQRLSPWGHRCSVLHFSASAREGWGLRSILFLHSLVSLSLERKDSINGRQDREILRLPRGCQNHTCPIYIMASLCLCFLHMHKNLTVAKWNSYNTRERATFSLLSLSILCSAHLVLTWCCDVLQYLCDEVT